MFSWRPFLAFLFMGLVSATSLAQPGYFLFKVGNPSLDDDFQTLNTLFREGLGIGDELTQIVMDEPSASYRLVEGSQLSRYLSMEIGLAYYGDIRYRATTASGDNLRVVADTYGAEVLLLGVYPVYRDIKAVGRAGIGYWRSDYNLKGAAPNVSRDGVEAVYGLALRKTLNRAMVVELSWDLNQIDDLDMGSLTLGFGFTY